MSIRVPCPGCGRTVEAPAEAAGKTGKCTTCGATIVVPAGEEIPAQEPPDVKRGVDETTIDSPVDETLYHSPPPLPPQPRRCRFCDEEIRADARKCKHCGEYLDPSLRADDAQRQFTEREHANRWLHPIRGPGGPSPFWGRVSKFGAFAAVMVTISGFWVLGAVMVSGQVAEHSQNDEASVFHRIYELLSWWAALQMLMLGVALAALAARFQREERDAADDPTSSAPTARGESYK